MQMPWLTQIEAPAESPVGWNMLEDTMTSGMELMPGMEFHDGFLDQATVIAL